MMQTSEMSTMLLFTSDLWLTAQVLLLPNSFLEVQMYDSSFSPIFRSLLKPLVAL